MSLFQSSVLKKYLKELDDSKVRQTYQQFSSYFNNPVIQQNIRESREEQFQEGFLIELFVKVLGYVINPNPDYNLTTEFKNQIGPKKADGAILKNGKAISVIELKSTKTKDLEAVRQQAFDYKANQENSGVMPLAKEFQLHQSNLNDLIINKFGISKLSRKLQNWDELEFAEFVKELKKAKVQLSLSQEAEWMGYFNQQKQKAQELKSEINRIEKEIDQMVYELYGLTEEQIKIVENIDKKIEI